MKSKRYKKESVLRTLAADNKRTSTDIGQSTACFCCYYSPINNSSTLGVNCLGQPTIAYSNVKRKANNDDLKTECQMCVEDVFDDPFFELVASDEGDHDHVVCVECFGKLHAFRGCATTLTCPSEGCNKSIVGH
jgi:hypothetical protein